MNRFRSLLVAALACAVAASALHAQKTPITLMDAFTNRALMGSHFATAKWLSDGRSYTVLKRDSAGGGMNIWRVDVATGEESMFVDLSHVHAEGSDEPFGFLSYDFSDDEHEIVFTLSQKRIWRRSTTGDYAVYTVKDGKLHPLPRHETGLRNVFVSPDGKKVGYVFEDNIHVMDLATGAETQLTHDTAEYVYNGRFGWVYEEEFSLVDGWMWSPDSKNIAYWHEDERGVPEYTLTDWSEVHPELTRIRYPKAGDPNPVEKIGVVSLDTRRTTWMDIGDDTDIYIPKMLWTGDPGTLCIYRLNRAQNRLQILFGDVRTGRTHTAVVDSSTTGWIEIEEGQTLGSYLRFLKKKKEFLLASERDGHTNVYLFDMNGRLVNQVTRGDGDVTDVAGLSPDERTLYYVSSEPAPTERHLYRVHLDGSDKKRLTTAPGWHTISMSPTCALYIDAWSSVTQPPRTEVFDADGGEVRTMADSDPERYAKYTWSPKELLTVPTSDGLMLHCSMIKPPDFDPAKKYPVYFDVYGGPASSSVHNAWPQTIHEWIANEGFIVFQIDNRGTTGRGADFKHRVYKVLGKWEASDYIDAAKYLGTLPYVDAAHIGIWGWSYGGYISALTLLLGGDTFAAAVAIAPVTDWKLYDTIYTERYMLRPEDNPDGYKVGSCVENAAKLTGHLLLVHGGLDDNVHLQNFMQLAAKLNAVGKSYDARIFPMGNHGIATSFKERIALYQYFMAFLKRHLEGT